MANEVEVSRCRCGRTRSYSSPPPVDPAPPPAVASRHREVAMTRPAVAFLCLVFLAAPLAAEAQGGTEPRRIGLLDTGSFAGRAPLWGAFRQGMLELGYVEGQTVIFEARSADGRPERLAALAAEFVRLKVDVIV